MNIKLSNQTLLEELINLILDEDTSNEEREILIHSKTSLDNDIVFSKVIYELKINLMPLAVQARLSKKVLNLYSEILRQFPKKDKWGIPRGFIL